MLIGLISILSSNKAYAKTTTNSLSECESPSNCVLIDWKVNDVTKTYQEALKIIEQMPRTKIVEIQNSYIHAEITSKIMHYVDDFEIVPITDKSVIQIRSESRVGNGDFGVNRKRIINFLNELPKD